MPVVAVAAVVAAGAVVAGTAMSISNANKARKAQKNQYAYERQLSQNRATRERRDAIRAARLSMGQVQQGAANQGAQDTSAFLGGFGSIQSQLNSNLSFLDTNQKLADQAGAQASKANGYLSAAQNWGAVSDLGKTVFSAAGGFGN